MPLSRSERQTTRARSTGRQSAVATSAWYGSFRATAGALRGPGRQRGATARGIARPSRARATALTGYRIRQKLSQTALAGQLGMRQPNVARLEAGARNPAIEMLERLVSVLGSRFIIDIAPAGRAAAALPADGRVVGNATGADGTRVLVAAG